MKKYLMIAPIKDKIRERTTRWYSNVMRRLPIAPIKMCLNMHVTAGCQRRGTPLKTWIKVIRKDLLVLKITDGLWEAMLQGESKFM